jgi:DNA-binding CsgD family transcriptional regulator
MQPDDLVPESAAAPADGEGVGATSAPGRQVPSCPKGLHGTERMRKYFRSWVCLGCKSIQRAAREKKARKNEPAAHRKATKPEMRERKVKIAAMAGAGAAPIAIARELGITQDSVEQTLRKDVKHDEFLQGVYREAERTLAPKAFAAAEKLINHITNVAEGYNVVVGNDDAGNPVVKHVDTAPHHAASALREMRPFIGMGDRAQGGGQQAPPAPATIQINSPEALAAVVRALRGHREETKAREQVLVEGERVS